jgi:hypothetical protein
MKRRRFLLTALTGAGRVATHCRPRLRSGRLTQLSARFIKAEWAPDAKHLYYMTLGGDLFRYDLVTNSATRLLERRAHLAAAGLPEAERAAASGLHPVIVLSPNGRWLALCWNAASTSLLDIYDTSAPLVSTPPHHRSRLSNIPISDVQWAPNGMSVVASRVFVTRMPSAYRSSTSPRASGETSPPSRAATRCC